MGFIHVAHECAYTTGLYTNVWIHFRNPWEGLAFLASLARSGLDHYEW